jgi:hypothetical protein
MNRLPLRLVLRQYIPVIETTVVILALAGCHSTPAPFDPFLAGRTTIAPPATAIPAGQTPYYSTQPPTVSVPGGQTTIYTPPGAVPAAVPVTPVPSDGSGRFPRGVSLPQSSNSTAEKDTQLVAAQPANSTATAEGEANPQRTDAPLNFKNALAGSARGGDVIPASYQEPASEPPIRIVVPPDGREQPVTKTAEPPTSRKVAQSPSPRETIPAGESSPRRLPELTDFPAVTNAVPREMPGYGFDPSYSWLKGKLEYSPSQKRWKLRYIAVEGPTDEFGGSVILADDKLAGFEPGDFVRVQGRLSQTAGAAKGFSPPYSIERISKQSAAKGSASHAG